MNRPSTILCAVAFLGSVSQAETQPTGAAAIQAKIAELQAQLALAQQAEKDLTAEKAAIAKADKARSYLASIGQPVPTASTAVTTVDAAAKAVKDNDVVATVTKTAAGSDQIVMSQPAADSSPKKADAEPGALNTKFGGLDFGVGLSFSYDLGSNERIKEAKLVNGIVRVTQSDNAKARFILESHYLFTPTGALFGAKFGKFLGVSNEDPKAPRWGWGPFVALQPGGSDNVIDAIGAGLMLGLRRTATSKDSFNIGVGMI